MKRIVTVVVLCAASYLAGYATNSHMTLAAQGQAAQAQNFPPVVEGKGMYWSGDDLRKVHTDNASLPLPRTPFYRFQMRRVVRDKPEFNQTTKTTTRWADAEMHDNRTDVYYIVGGSGTVILGGEIVNKRESPGDEYVGQPVKGGTAYKVKAGDLLLIPPRTVHQNQPDPGGMTYVLLTMATRTNAP